MQIDHIIYAHPDLGTAVASLEDHLGVRASGGGRHPGRGTHNELICLGPRTYLEIIAPDPGQPEPSAPRPYGADGVTSGRLVGWALTVDDVDAAVALARARGFDPGDVLEGQRENPAGARLRWRQTGNALAGGLVPFLVDWGDTPHPAGSAPGDLRLTSVSIEHPDPPSLVRALAALDAQVEVRQAAEPALVARIEGPHGVRELR